MGEKLVLEEEDRDLAIEQYTSKLRELRTKIAALRKEGRDPLVADSMLRNIQSKMGWAKINGEPDDFRKIEESFEEVQVEIKDAAEKGIVNIKAEVMAKAKAHLDQVKQDEQDRLAARDAELEAKSVEASAPQSDLPPSLKEILEGVVSGDKNKISIVEQLLMKELEKRRQEEEKKKLEEQQRLDLERKAMEEKQIHKNKEHVYSQFIKNPVEYFYLMCGQQMVSLNDFIAKLSLISNECFVYHTREENNDFAKWVLGVFHDEELSKRIKGLHDRHQMIEILRADKRGE